MNYPNVRNCWGTSSPGLTRQSTCTYSYSIIHSHLLSGVTLTNAYSQPLRVVPWTSHSAVVLSTLALLVASEGEYCSPTTTTSNLIHLLPDVPRHQLVLWVVPLYWSGQWPFGLQTVHSLISRPDGQRHIRLCVIEASAAVLQESSGRCSERMYQEEQLRG